MEVSTASSYQCIAVAWEAVLPATIRVTVMKKSIQKPWRCYIIVLRTYKKFDKKQVTGILVYRFISQVPHSYPSKPEDRVGQKQELSGEGGSQKHYIYGEDTIFLIEGSQAMSVRPLVEVCFKKGKAVRSNKGLWCGLRYVHRISEGTLLRMIGINFDDKLGRAIS
jgi:hypothetical protein